MKKNILVFFFIFFGVLISGGIVRSADPLIVVAPSSLNINIDSGFDLTVMVKTDASKVCVVKGIVELT